MQLRLSNALRILGLLTLVSVTDLLAQGPADPGACTTTTTAAPFPRDSVHMAVASAEGDVLFDGRLFGAGDSMCGIVTYHQGARFVMTATKRPRARR